MKIIAFCGSKGSGKSTSCDLLKEMVDPTVKIKEVAFAQRLKDVCSEAYGLEMKYFIDPALKEVQLEDIVVITRDSLVKVFDMFNIKSYSDSDNIKPYVNTVINTPRRLLQFIGTDVLHKVDPLIHVKYAESQLDKDAINIITDLRFEQEFNFMMDNYPESFIPVYVMNSAAETAAEVDAHPSEREFRKFDTKCRVLNNNSSWANLRAEVDNIYRNLL